MDQEKKLKKNEETDTETSGAEDAVSDTENTDIVEKALAPKSKKAARVKKIKEEKPKPAIGQKLQFAAYATLSTTERIINGLSEAYKNIFVGHETVKVNFDKEQALKYYDKGNYEKAVEYFQAYIDNGNDKDEEALYLMAMSYVNLEELKKAIEYFKKAEKLDPDNPDIISELSACLVSTEEYGEAVVYLKKAIGLDSENGDNYYQLGTCHEKLGQIEDAKKMYKKAIDISPREAVYYQALGFLYENSDNHKDAIVCFKKAMDLDRSGKKRGGGVKA